MACLVALSLTSCKSYTAKETKLKKEAQAEMVKAETPPPEDVIIAELEKTIIPVIDFEDTSVGFIICPKSSQPFPSSIAEEGEVWSKLTGEQITEN